MPSAIRLSFRVVALVVALLLFLAAAVVKVLVMLGCI